MYPKAEEPEETEEINLQYTYEYSKNLKIEIDSKAEGRTYFIIE